ncbi:MAG: ATP-binding cassette domain-containing protein [Paracoccaceae bacterium]
MLTVKNLLVRHDTFSLRADWSVQSGSRTVVIGPSGAGKSTLIGAVAGFVDVAQGQITLDGTDITHANPANRDIAMLFQDGNLFPALTLEQNVSLGLRPSLKLNAEERKRVHTVLNRVGLSGFEKRKPGQVSGGQQGRAALARILLQRKPLLLLDEPFSALGPALRQEMLDLVNDVLDETQATLLMVTHNPDDAKHIAQDIIFLDDGVAHSPEPAEQLLANPHPALKSYLG